MSQHGKYHKGSPGKGISCAISPQAKMLARKGIFAPTVNCAAARSAEGRSPKACEGKTSCAYFTTGKNACLQGHFCAVRQLCSCAKHRGAKPEGLRRQGFLRILYHTVHRGAREFSPSNRPPHIRHVFRKSKRSIFKIHKINYIFSACRDILYLCVYQRIPSVVQISEKKESESEWTLEAVTARNLAADGRVKYGGRALSFPPAHRSSSDRE